jgi:hypothetical protein
LQSKDISNSLQLTVPKIQLFDTSWLLWQGKEKAEVFENRGLRQSGGGGDRKLEKTAQVEASSFVVLTTFGLSNQGD